MFPWEYPMRVTGNGHPPLREGRVEELAMAALLAPKNPTLRVEPVQNIADLHGTTVSRPGAEVNADTPNVRPH